MGLFDSADDVPEKQTAWFDKDTNDLMEKNIREGIASPQEQYDKIDKNLAVGGDTYGKLSNGFDSAIKSKYGKLLNQNLDQEKFNQRLNVRSNQIAGIQRGQQAMLALQQVQNDSYANYMQAVNLREEARSAAIKSITGAAGSVAGFGAAGGFGGGGAGGAGGAGGGSANVGSAFNANSNDSSFLSTFKSIQNQQMQQQRGESKSRNYRDNIQGVGDFGRYA